jgi:shikimate dehydrogenase
MENQWQIDAGTVVYGVFGDPVKHSKSPLMLNRAFREAGVPAVYAAFHVRPEGLAEAVRGVRAMGFGGINVTIPHKVAVMELMDELDETAAAIGAVNTVVHRDGRLIGYNTDGIGYVRSLKEETGMTVEGKRIAVIGAGGAARGIVYALLKEGPERVLVLNRTVSSAERLAADMGRYGAVEGWGLAELAKMKDEIDLLINTTSVGMHPHTEEMPVPADLLASRMTVSDIVYNPRRTKLLAEAEARGLRTHGGLGMFVYQGAYAFEYWTGRPAPVAAMREAVERSP